MKSTAIFVIFCIIVGSFATMDLSPIENNKFGRTLLDTIQLQLGAKAPVQKILGMLEKMSSDLHQEQKVADDLHEKNQNECSADKAAFKREIEDAISQITTNEDNKAAAEATLSRQEPKLEQEQKDLAQSQSDLAALNNQRVSESVEYAKRVQEHEDSIVTIIAAKELFKKLEAQPVAGAAFLEKGQTVLVQVRSHLTSQALKMSNKSHKAIFTLLAQIAERAPIQSDQAIVSKILDLCQQVEDNLNDSFTTEKQAEAKRIAVYKSAKASLEQDIRDSEALIAKLQAQIAGLKADIIEYTNNIAEQTKRRDNNTNSLNERIKQCDAEMANYKADRDERNGERDIVDQVHKLIQERLSGLSDYIKKRVDHVE